MHPMLGMQVHVAKMKHIAERKTAGQASCLVLTTFLQNALCKAALCTSLWAEMSDSGFA